MQRKKIAIIIVITIKQIEKIIKQKKSKIKQK